MAKGDGSIREVKNKDGKSYRPKKWRVCVSFGFDPITKKREQVTRIVTGSKVEAQKKRDEIKREHEAGISSDGYKITFDEFAMQWIKRRETMNELQERSLTQDRQIVPKLNDYLGKLKLQDITPQIIENTLSAIKTSKQGKKGDTLSGTTMHAYYQKLNQILNDAEFKGLILRNPCARVKPPKKDKPNRKALTPSEFMKFNEATEKELEGTISTFLDKESRKRKNKPRGAVRGIRGISFSIAVKLGIATGARIGEILALRWCDIDFNKSVVCINQALTNTGNTKLPKNGNTRDITIDSPTLKILEKWQTIQKEALETIGINQSKETPVCCSDVGIYSDVPNFETWFGKFRARVGFPDLRFHELRHTQATQLINNGMDIKTVQTRLGHSSASTTLDFYAHASDEKDKEAAEIIGEIISGKKKETPIITIKTA